MKVAIIGLLICLNGYSLLAQDCDNKMFFLEAIKSQFLYQDTIITSIDKQQIIALDNGLYRSLQNLKCYKENVLKDVFFSATTKYLKGTAEFYEATQADSVIKDRVTGYWNDNQAKFSCYSFFKSTSNWYTLTFLTEGKYAPMLILVNYNPHGQVNAGGTLFSKYIDAGEYFVTSSSQRGDTLIISDVIKWEKYYKDADRFTTLTDSTTTSYIVHKTGQLVQTGERRIKFEK
jgi:hypothetical protein